MWIMVKCGFAWAAYTCYLALGFIFRLAQSLFWRLNGTWTHLKDANYEKSAQIMDIILRYSADDMVIPGSFKSFICTHAEFDHPSVVLKNHVSLFCVEKTRVIFVETDTNVDVRSSDVDAFIRIAQYRYARRLIILPIASFHRLAEEVGTPKQPLLLVTNTTRCGSTLFAQLFENTGLCNVFCEPEMFAKSWEEAKKLVSHDELVRITKHSISLLLKPRLGEPEPLLNVVKLPAPSVSLLPELEEAFPKAIQVFMYRDALPTAQSFCRAVYTSPGLLLVIKVALVSPWFGAYVLEEMTGLKGEDYKFNMTSELTASVLIWCNECSRYNEILQEGGHSIRAVKYEDILADKEGFTRKLFQYCGLPERLVPLAMRAFEQDSQRNSTLSREKLSKFTAPKLTTKIEKEMDEICEKFGLPKIRQPCNLEQSLR